MTALGKGLSALLPEKRGKIHAAPVIGNPRLEPLLMALMQRKKLTSQELHEITGSMAIHSDIAEIRAQGYAIGPAKYKGLSESGRKVYEYSWEGEMKSTAEILDTRFRLAMKEGRKDPKKKYDVVELTGEQKNNIMAYMRCVGKVVTEQELDVCFRSFRRQYWKEHVLPPRTVDAPV